MTHQGRPHFNCGMARFLFLLPLVLLSLSSANSSPALNHNGEYDDNFISENGAMEKAVIPSCNSYDPRLDNSAPPIVTDIVDLDCGGVVKLLPNKRTLLLRYDSMRNRKKNQHCLWNIHKAGNNGQNYLIKLKATLLCQSTGDTLSVLRWDVFTGISSNRLSNQREYSSDFSDFFFLSFNTNSNGFLENTAGFIIRVEVDGVKVWYDGLHVAHRSTPGRGTYDSFNAGQQVSVILNPQNFKTNYTLNVNYIDTLIPEFDSHYYDESLNLYEIGPSGGIYNLGRLRGNYTSPLTITSQYPILAMFWTKDAAAQRGFSLSWI